MLPVEIYLMRHGETDWNVAGRYQGKLDSPLTERGILQAEACGRLLAATVDGVDAFFASPLGRTRQTSSIIHTFGSFPEILWEPRLAEVSAGSWDGLTKVDIDSAWSGLLDAATRYDWYFRSPDGESYEAAMARANEWLTDIEGTVVAISHGLIGRIIRGAYLGLSKDDTLSLPVRQDVIWQLAQGEIKAIV